jgi:hypothetical protein
MSIRAARKARPGSTSQIWTLALQTARPSLLGTIFPCTQQKQNGQISMIEAGISIRLTSLPAA